MTAASQAPPQARRTSTSPRPDALANLDARDRETAPLNAHDPWAARDQNHYLAPGSPANSQHTASVAAEPQRNGAPTLPVMVGAVLLMVLTAALLTQVTTYWIMGAAVALEAAALAGSVTWRDVAEADRDQNLQPPQTTCQTDCRPAPVALTRSSTRGRDPTQPSPDRSGSPKRFSDSPGWMIIDHDLAQNVIQSVNLGLDPKMTPLWRASEIRDSRSD